MTNCFYFLQNEHKKYKLSIIITIFLFKKYKKRVFPNCSFDQNFTNMGLNLDHGHVDLMHGLAK